MQQKLIWSRIIVSVFLLWNQFYSFNSKTFVWLTDYICIFRTNILLVNFTFTLWIIFPIPNNYLYTNINITIHSRTYLYTILTFHTIWKAHKVYTPGIDNIHMHKICTDKAVYLLGVISSLTSTLFCTIILCTFYH